jgi:hypothetical protein
MEMKQSTLLKKAQQRIANGQDRFICHALESVARDSHVSAKPMKRWVMELLKGHSQYEHWVARHHHLTFLRMREKDAFRAGRLQWMNWMIKQWEAQGK